MWLLGIYGGIGPVVVVSIEKLETDGLTLIDSDHAALCSCVVSYRRDLGRSSVQLWPSRKPIQCERTTS